MTAEEDSVDKLCALARDHLQLYRQHLPKPGMRHFPNEDPMKALCLKHPRLLQPSQLPSLYFFTIL